MVTTIELVTPSPAIPVTPALTPMQQGKADVHLILKLVLSSKKIQGKRQSRHLLA
jgi:hypothetical protein